MEFTEQQTGKEFMNVNELYRENEATACEMGLTFNGMQDLHALGWRPLFSHDEYGTFVVLPGETIKGAVERVRRRFLGARVAVMSKEY